MGTGATVGNRAEKQGYLFKMSQEVYDEKVARELNEMGQSFLSNEGKYSKVIKTVNGEIIYVIPPHAGKPNEVGRVKVLIANIKSGIAKNRLEGALTD